MEFGLNKAVDTSEAAAAAAAGVEYETDRS